jgi:hypothetical protein
MRALRWSYPAGLFDEANAAAAPAARHASRANLQTGAAILALALAFDVSAASQSWSPSDSAAVFHAEARFEPLQMFDDHGLDLTALGPGAWTIASSGADGWFV